MCTARSPAVLLVEKKQEILDAGPPFVGWMPSFTEQQSKNIVEHLHKDWVRLPAFKNAQLVNEKNPN